MKVQNYNPDCNICNALEKDEHIIYEGKLIAWIPYPRWNENPFRSALVPKRHLGADGKYRLAKLSSVEEAELDSLEIVATDAIVSAIKNSGMKLEPPRQGMELIDSITRPGIHPNRDLMPKIEPPAKLAGYVFPRSLDAEIEANSANIKKTAKIIAVSFADAQLKPEDLVNEEVRILQKYSKI